MFALFCFVLANRFDGGARLAMKSSSASSGAR
jgi:hypothetical protein